MGKTSNRLLALSLVCCLAGTAVAQKSRRPEAEAAFKQGKDLMTRGEYDAACKKFEASQALEPRASTLMNLAACQEAQKKLVTAWSTFLDAARLAASSDDKIEKALVDPSNAKAKALESRLSSIEIVVSDAARVPGLVISRDGQLVVEGQWNSKIPIDGGDYTIVARARDTDAWTATIAVASERDEKRVEIPMLKANTPEPPSPPPPDDRVQPPPDDIRLPPPGEPSPPDQPLPLRDPVTDTGGGYPASLVDRPLILPSGMLEVAGYFWIPTRDGIDLFDYVTMTVSGRYSTGTLEPFAGAELAVIKPESNVETLQALFAGVGAAVGPGVARGQITKLGVDADVSWFVLTGRYEYKQKLQPKLAVLADAGLEINTLSADPDFSANAVYLSIGGAGQARLSPVVALQGWLRLNVPVSSGGQDPDVFTWNTVAQLYGEGLYNVGKLDLFARLGVTMVEDSTTTAFVVGVLARPM